MMGSMNPDSPFPMRTKNGTTIVDERCTCGCKRSEHNHSLAWGHGSCRNMARCYCPKFSWAASLYGRTQEIGK